MGIAEIQKHFEDAARRERLVSPQVVQSAARGIGAASSSPSIDYIDIIRGAYGAIVCVDVATGAVSIVGQVASANGMGTLWKNGYLYVGVRGGTINDLTEVPPAGVIRFAYDDETDEYTADAMYAYTGWYGRDMRDFDVDASGNVYMVGKNHSWGGSECNVVACSADGTELWRYLCPPGNEYAHSVAVSSGGVYCGGYFRNQADTGNVHVIQLNGSGVFQAEYDHGGAIYVVRVDGGNVIIGGVRANGGDGSAVVRKLTSGLGHQWSYDTGGTASPSRVEGMEIDGSGNVYVIGAIEDDGPAIRKLSGATGASVASVSVGGGDVKSITLSSTRCYARHAGHWTTAKVGYNLSAFDLSLTVQDRWLYSLGATYSVGQFYRMAYDSGTGRIFFTRY